MNYGIIYASTAGGTEQSAKIIKDKLTFEHQVPEGNIELFDLNKKVNIEINKYSRCVIGTGIYAGKPHKLVKSFINMNIEALLNVPLSIYICSLADDEENERYRQVFPEKLLKHATPVSFFGGMVVFKRLNPFVRLIMKMITKSKKDIHKLKYDVINQFAVEISEKEPDL